jgi:hypothetical protein
MKNISLYCIFVLLLINQACTKDSPYSDNRVRCYVTSEVIDNKPTVDFIYSKRQLIKIIEYDDQGKVKQHLVPGFDGEGKISIIRYFDVNNNAYAFLNYEYLPNRLLKKTSFYKYGPVEDTLVYYRVFYYNDINQLTKEYYYLVNNKVVTMDYYINHTYNTAGNITFSSKYRWVAVSAKDYKARLEFSSEYEYDLMRSKSLELPFLSGYTSLSPNNAIKAKFRDEYGSDLATSYYSSYEYNSEGYPTKEVRTFMFGGESKVIEYKYNCINPNDTVPYNNQ